MDAVELEIRITGVADGKFVATVEKSPAGPGGRVDFELPELNAGEAGETTALNLVLEQGELLFRRVFRDQIGVAFENSFRLAQERGGWFRLQLAFDRAPMAAAWPWEALVGPAGIALALLPKVSIERRLCKAPAAVRPRPLRVGVLRGLLVGAGPQNLAQIDLDSEKRWIRKVLTPPEFELKIDKKASRRKLDRQLGDPAGFDFVHFFGHGDFKNGDGGLWLVNASGSAERLNSRELVAFLRGPVPFVFLNVCDGARGSANPFAGLADALLQLGVGAVVAMRREVKDEKAVELAKGFYRRIAGGETVARALAESRREEVESGEWAIPVLYLAGDDFALRPGPAIRPAAPSKEPVAEPERPPQPAGRPRWLRLLAASLGVVAAAALAYGLWPAPPPKACVRPGVESDPECPRFADLDLPLAFIADPQGAATDFCIARFEITRGQYAKVMGRRAPPAGEAWLPQEGVGWNDSQVFVEGLRQRYPEASCYLPRDAQWLFAARAGRPEQEAADAAEPANCKGDEDGFPQAACVGSFAPNGWGLYDMSGNLWEWTQDVTWTNRASLADLPGPEQGDKRIRRGGSYATVRENCSFTKRTEVKPDRKQEAAGFRIACDPLAKK